MVKAKYFLGMMAIASLFIFVACGGGETSSSETESPKPQETTSTASTEAPAQKAEEPKKEEPKKEEPKPEPKAEPKKEEPKPDPAQYAGPNLGLNTNKVFSIHVPADASAKARLVSLGINVPQTGSLEEANHEFMAGLNVD